MTADPIIVLTDEDKNDPTIVALMNLISTLDAAEEAADRKLEALRRKQELISNGPPLPNAVRK